jgi:5-methylcytosine-specific restriction endonuclease McrA
MLAEAGAGGEKKTPGDGSVAEASAAQARIEKIRAHQRAWREKNKERMREYAKRWHEKNPDRAKSYRSKNKSGCTPTMLLGLMAAQGGKCALCGDGLEKSRHLDHLIPKSKGGASNLSNYQYLCPTCNAAKGALTNDEFVEHIGKILKFLGQ